MYSECSLAHFFLLTRPHFLVLSWVDCKWSSKQRWGKGRSTWMCYYFITFIQFFCFHLNLYYASINALRLQSTHKQHKLKGEFHGSAHARILTGLCTLSGKGPGFSLFMNQSWASYLILHANSPKIINRRINWPGQQLNSTVHCVGKICWNPLRILVIRLLPRLTIASDYWTTSQCGFWSDNID